MTLFRVAAFSNVVLLTACSSLGPFKEVDTNQDGHVSHEEAALRSEDLASLFNTADEDKDGALNEEEYEFVRAFLQKSRTSTHRGPPKTRGGSGGGGHSHWGMNGLSS
jgi:hypothetical protein